MYLAVRAREAGHPDEFERYFQQVREAFAEADRLKSTNYAVAAITAGTLLQFADRLPEDIRPALYAQAYDDYAFIWKEQGKIIDKMPVHFRGEMLAGMAESALRTGRAEEGAQFLDRLLADLPGSPYEATARQWKADPQAAARNSTLTCKTCHDAGRLSTRLAALAQAK
jgi:hypothetical protein